MNPLLAACLFIVFLAFTSRSQAYEKQRCEADGFGTVSNLKCEVADGGTGIKISFVSGTAYARPAKVRIGDLVISMPDSTANAHFQSGQKVSFEITSAPPDKGCN